MTSAIRIIVGTVGAAVWAAFGTAAVSAADWPHWRGPDRNGVVAEHSGWFDGRWHLGEAVWKAQVGTGSSSPLVVDGKVYVLGWRDGRDIVSCLHLADGMAAWSVEYACPQYGRLATGDEGLYAGPCSTPEFDADTKLLYTLSIDGDLHCWDTAGAGRNVWSLNLYERYQVGRRPRVGRSGLRDYGYTSSPLVHGPWLIVEVGSNRATLVAFDKRTGREQWLSEHKGPAGHNGGPVPMRVEGVPCVAVLTHNDLLVARLDGPRAGRTVATFPWLTEFANNIASPTVHGEEVLITSAYNRNAICKLKITLGGAEKVWEHDYPSKVCSPVVFENRVYWVWQKVICVDYVSGRPLWSSAAEFGDPGSCIATRDGRLIAWAHRGKLVLVETAGHSPDKYTELARREGLFRTEVWPHVVLAGGRLLLKDRDGNLLCLPITAAR